MGKALDRYRNSEAIPPETPNVSDTHIRVVGFVDELISTMLGQNTTLSPVVKMLHRMKPALLRDLSTVPEKDLRAFMVDLGGRMLRAGDPTVVVSNEPEMITAKVVNGGPVAD